MSVLVKQNPGREGEEDRETRVDEWRRTQVGFQIAKLNDPMSNQRQRNSAQDADHPRGEIRAEDIDRQRMIAQEPRCDEEHEDEQQKPAARHNSDDYPVRFHFANDLTVPGRSGRADGRARSPVLKASAAALVKMADCVSWPTLRAAVRFR